MKKIIVLLVIAAVFAGCHGNPQEVTKNGDFKVEFLFEHDGCKMYRFNDGGQYVYWSNCKGTVEEEVTYNSNKQTYTYKVQSITTQK